MVTVRKDTPKLFFNTGSEDKEAYLLIKGSGMPCEFRAPSLEKFTPLLLVGYKRYIGINEIKAFISVLLEERDKG